MLGLSRMQIRRRQQISLIDRSVTVCLRSILQTNVASTLLESNVGAFEVLNVRRIPGLCLKPWSHLALRRYTFIIAKATVCLKYTISVTSRFKAHANGRNKSQHCCVLLEVSGQQCCVRLTGFKLYATSANKCQHRCGSMQMDATRWAQHCCVLLASNVVSVCIGLKTKLRHPTHVQNFKRADVCFK